MDSQYNLIFFVTFKKSYPPPENNPKQSIVNILQYRPTVKIKAEHCHIQACLGLKPVDNINKLIIQFLNTLLMEPGVGSFFWSIVQSRIWSFLVQAKCLHQQRQTRLPQLFLSAFLHFHNKDLTQGADVCYTDFPMLEEFKYARQKMCVPLISPLPPKNNNNSFY